MWFNKHGFRNSPLILVVDDDIQMINMIRSNLEAEGYRIEFATDGLTGKQKAWELKPDLIIADIFMPGVDGLSMLDNIRKEPEMQKIPVIFLSGKAQENIKPEPNPLNRYALLKKPVFLPELNQLIHSFLKPPN